MSDTQIPLLNAEAMLKLIAAGRHTVSMEEAEAASKVNEWFHAKITSGELMVVKTVRLIQKHPGGPPISNTEVPMNCPNCRAFDVPSKTQWWKFCPGCGAEIVE